MNKIRLLVHPDTCFIFHMLSVSKCGYENDHGAKYRSLYAPNDLAILHKYEPLLTVQGGEYCGKLYWHLVAQPACGKMSAMEFYHAFPQSAEAKHLAEFHRPISEICSVMERCYPIFQKDVWPQSKAAIENYIVPLADRFDESKFTDCAEQLVGCTLIAPAFYALMTDSMENGAEGIDIAPDMDVFSITRSYEEAYTFIAHEFIIYLLKSALQGTSAFQSVATWPITEALAEYYLQQIVGQNSIFTLQEKWRVFYEELAIEHPDLTPVDLYRAAEAALQIVQ